MPNINDTYKSHGDKLKAEDLGTNMYTMTISGAELVKFSDTDHKVVLSFHEDARALPLNKTNAMAIADIHGPDWSMWSGRQIVLFSMAVEFQGRMTQGIRIRAPQVQQQQQPLAATNAAHPVHQPLTPAPTPPMAPVSAPGQQPHSELNPPPVSDNEIPF